jgi:protein-S-isoprenylcysteine O-methyltransferase Ste14
MWLLLKNLLFTLLVPGFIAGWVPLRWLHRGANLPDVWLPRHYAAAPLLLAGTVIYAACVWQFATTGRGTPAPIDPPKKLVMRGLYRWVRNPMYLGVLLFVLGEAIFFSHVTLLLYFVFLASAFQLFVLAHEEPGLRQRYGSPYGDYCNWVPRWIPRRPRPPLQTVDPFHAAKQ